MHLYYKTLTYFDKISGYFQKFEPFSLVPITLIIFCMRRKICRVSSTSEGVSVSDSGVNRYVLRTQIAITKIVFNTQDFSPVRLPTQGRTLINISENAINCWSQSYQQWDIRHDHSAVLVERELWHKLQDLVVLEGDSSVVVEFDVNFLHIFSANKEK